MIEFACPSCQVRYRVADEQQGVKTVCRHCRQPLQVPLAAFPGSPPVPVALSAASAVAAEPPLALPVAVTKNPAPPLAVVSSEGYSPRNSRGRYALIGGGVAIGLLVLGGLLVGLLAGRGGSTERAQVAQSSAPTAPGATLVPHVTPANPPRYWDVAAAAKPMLAIEAEGHTGTVKNVFLRDQGRQAITVSLDKTVRIWDVETGDLLHTSRLPSGSGELGQPEAAALSADESLLVVAGRAPQDGPAPLYLIAPATGQLLRLIPTQFPVVRALAFSADGKWLAISPGDKTASILNLESGRIERTFTHDAEVYSLAFSPEGQRLLVGINHNCYIWPVAGGKHLLAFTPSLQLYNPDDPTSVDELRDRFSLGGPNRAVAWAPDGKTVAVGSDDGAIRIYDMAGKRLLRVHLSQQPAREWTRPVTAIQYIAGGQALFYAGCNVRGHSATGVLDVATGKRRAEFQYEDKIHPVSGGAVAADGQLAISSGGPAHEVHVWKTEDATEVNCFASRGRPLQQFLAWSPDGKRIAWRQSRQPRKGLYPLDRAFRLDDLGFDNPPTEATIPWTNRSLPRTANYTLTGYGMASVTRRRLSERDTVGEVIKCDRTDEEMRHVVYLGNDRAAVQGKFGIYIVDMEKRAFVRKLTGHTAPALLMAPSPDGKRLASASADQTIRIWDPDQEEPLLNLFVTETDWVAWTNQGYYAASAGGERLMGWQIGNGPDALASFHPAAQFRKSLYRPDLLQRVVQTGNMAEALAQAARDNKKPAAANVEQARPPLVAITDPPGPSGHRVAGPALTVRAAARGVGGQPVTAMRLLVDGRPYGGAKGVQAISPPRPGDVEVSWPVQLPPGKHILAVQAETPASKGLSPVVEVTNTAGAAAVPNLYVVAVGINAYPEPLQLAYAAPDADAIVKALGDQANSRAFRAVEVKLLKDQQATRAGIEQAIGWLKTKMTPQDVGIFFFSGHGGKDERGNFYLIPVDVNGRDLAGTCTSGAYIKQALGEIPGRVVAIMDACHSGAAIDVNRRPPAADDLIRDLISDDYGIVVLSSSLSQEFSLESPEVQHGFYTQALVEGLSGLADRNRNGLVDLNELERYTSRRVAELSHDKQHPVANRPSSIRAFALAKSTTLPPPLVPPPVPDVKVPPLAEKTELQGLWQVLTYEVNGMPRDYKDYYWAIHRDTIRHQGPNSSSARWKFKLDTSTGPKQIDIPQMDLLRHQEYYMKGIYDLQGNTLKVCIQVTAAGARPTEFRSDSRLIYAVMKRLTSNPDTPPQWAMNGIVEMDQTTELVRQPTEVVQFIRFVPDGTMLAVTSAEGVQLWDVATAKPLRWLIQMRGVQAVDFSFDSKRVLTSTPSGVTIFELATGKEVANFKVTDPLVAALSPDGKTVFVASGEVVQLIDVASGKTQELPRIPGARLRCGSFTADSKTLSVLLGSHILVCDVETGKERTRWDTKQPVTARADMTEDGRTLAIAVNWNIKLYEVGTGREIRTLTGAHQYGVGFVRFSADAQWLISIAVFGTHRETRLWDVASGKSLMLHGFGRQKIETGAVSWDRKFMACPDPEKGVNIHLWRLDQWPQ